MWILWGMSNDQGNDDEKGSSGWTKTQPKSANMTHTLKGLEKAKTRQIKGNNFRN